MIIFVIEKQINDKNILVFKDTDTNFVFNRIQNNKNILWQCFDCISWKTYEDNDYIENKIYKPYIIEQRKKKINSL